MYRKNVINLTWVNIRKIINKKCKFASGSKYARSYLWISEWDESECLRKLSPPLLHLLLAFALASSLCTLGVCIYSSFCNSLTNPFLTTYNTKQIIHNSIDTIRRSSFPSSPPISFSIPTKFSIYSGDKNFPRIGSSFPIRVQCDMGSPSPSPSSPPISFSILTKRKKKHLFL